MICVYDPGNENFTNNGDAFLTPISGTVTQVAAGNYDLQMVHPVDEFGAWKHLVPGAVVKVPVPEEIIENSFSGYDADVYKVNTGGGELRESAEGPEEIIYPTWGYVDIEVGTKVSYNGRNYVCNYWDPFNRAAGYPPTQVDWWSEIPRYTSGAEIVVTLPAGTDLYLIDDYDTDWYEMSTYYGVTGFILKSQVTFDRHVSAQENEPRVITEQLFRLKEPIIDNDNYTVTVTGQHISYDLSGVLLGRVSISKAPPAMALSRIMEGMMIGYKGNIATNLTDEDAGTYTGEINGKNAMFALLDPDKGMVQAFNARFTRDNWDLFVMKNVSVDRGYRMRFAKNARGINWKQSSTGIVTRVVPVAKAENGDDLYLPEKWVDSTRISQYPVIMMEQLRVNAQVGKDDGTGTDTLWTESALLDHMRDVAQQRYTIDKADQIKQEITIQFEQLGDTAEFSWLKGMEHILLYDTVKAIDERVGLSMDLYVTELEWDFMRKKVTGVKLSNTVGSSVRTVTGYNVQNNCITRDKLTDDVAAQLIDEMIGIIPDRADPDARENAIQDEMDKHYTIKGTTDEPVTDLIDDLPVNSTGDVILSASLSPTGTQKKYTYWKSGDKDNEDLDDWTLVLVDRTTDYIYVKNYNAGTARSWRKVTTTAV